MTKKLSIPSFFRGSTHAFPKEAWQSEKAFALSEWASHWFQQACAWARREAQTFLEALDAWLLAPKPQGWQVVGQRPRTVVTRFGEMTFRRRLYRDPQGHTWFLLNEVLNLPAHQGAAAEGTEAVVALAAETVFGRAAEVLALLTAGVLPPSTIWRLTQRIGKNHPGGGSGSSGAGLWSGGRSAATGRASGPEALYQSRWRAGEAAYRPGAYGMA